MPATKLACVRASPERIRAGDRAGWLALFDDGATIEDPVGTRPHRRSADAGRDELGPFYDTFIRGNDIRFEVSDEIEAGDEVARDVTIRTRLGLGLETTVPAFLFYRLVELGGRWRIAGLRAHWELGPVMLQALRGGLRGAGAMTIVFGRMLQNQGLGGAASFTRGLLNGMGDAGRDAVARFVDAVNGGDMAALEGLCTAGARIECPAPRAVSLQALVQRRRMAVSRVVVADRSVAFRVVLGGDRGVGVFELAPRSGKIESARLFLTTQKT
jgi:SnoaL-like protein